MQQDTKTAQAANLTLGAALSNQGRHAEAIAECREAIRLEPDHAGAHYNLGRALQDQGRVEQALAEYRKALDYAEPESKLAQRIQRALNPRRR
jgi:Flp pilus assembly protein TadD